jgi:hypothetical protein
MRFPASGFLLISFLHAPKYHIKATTNFYENSLIYSKVIYTGEQLTAGVVEYLHGFS